MHADLRAAARRVHGCPLPVAEKTMKRILCEPRAAGMTGAVDHRPVGFVVGGQHAGAFRGGQQPAGPQSAAGRHAVVQFHPAVVSLEAERAARAGHRTDRRLRQLLRPPRPRVAEPQRRHHVKRCRVGAAVGRRDPDRDLLGRGLGVFDEDVEPAVVGEDARVEQLVLGPLSLPPLILFHEQIVGKRPLRIAVPQAHEGVRRRVVDVEVILLHVFAMIALQRGQAEEAFLEMPVPFVPEGRRETEDLKPVADSGDPIFAPAVGLRTRRCIRKISPGIPIGRIILPNGSPGTVG